MSTARVMGRTSVTGKFMRPGCLESENGITKKDSDRPDEPVAVKKRQLLKGQSSAKVSSNPPMIWAARLYRKAKTTDRAVKSTASMTPMTAVRPKTRPVLT